MTELQEARLLGRAIRSRWNIPDETRADVIDQLHRIATGGAEESSRIAAARAIIAAEGQNQKDEHAEVNDIQRKIIELAAQFGIDLLNPGAAEGEAGSNPRRIIGADGRQEE